HAIFITCLISVILYSLFLSYSVNPYLYSFPTRRSSDLYENVFTMEEALTLSLDPANKDEPLYTPPVDEGEETKTIPVFNGGVYKDRKSTRLNSSHVSISYAVFCLKKKI